MSNTRVFIGRLNHRARESDVERFFKGYGKLRDISLKNGYGFVQFDDARLIIMYLNIFFLHSCHNLWFYVCLLRKLNTNSNKGKQKYN